MTKKWKIASNSLNISSKRFELCRSDISLSAHARTPGIYYGGGGVEDYSGGGIGVGYPVIVSCWSCFNILQSVPSVRWNVNHRFDILLRTRREYAAKTSKNRKDARKDIITLRKEADKRNLGLGDKSLIWSWNSRVKMKKSASRYFQYFI